MNHMFIEIIVNLVRWIKKNVKNYDNDLS